MVLTGHILTPVGTFLNESEIVSLDEANHPVPSCLKTLKPYPHKVEGTVGESIQDGIRYVYLERAGFTNTHSIAFIYFRQGAASLRRRSRSGHTDPSRH